MPHLLDPASGPPSARALPAVGHSSVELLNERLHAIHDEIRRHFPFVARVAVALYDSQTDDIKTFLCSPLAGSPLTHYSTKLSAATWLSALRNSHEPRVIDDLEATDLGTHVHSLKIRESRFKASFTVPIYDARAFVGFVFFNADRRGAFTRRVTAQLSLFVRIISLMVENTLLTAQTLVGSVHLLREISRFRDDETTGHLARMSHYAELIARSIAQEAGRDDEWVEQVRLFSPLHDVGKVATPDAILLKPGRLTPEEFAVMKLHPVQGAHLLGSLVQRLDLGRTPHIHSLLDIARYHHECWDGSGYPDGLAREAIPLEARIVKVADVFDALTSARCYKPRWPVTDAVRYLREGRGTQFDARCVDVFLSQVATVRDIMRRFREAPDDVP